MAKLIIEDDQYKEVHRHNYKHISVAVVKGPKDHSWYAFSNGKEFASNSNHISVDSAMKNAREVIKSKTGEDISG